LFSAKNSKISVSTVLILDVYDFLVLNVLNQEFVAFKFLAMAKKIVTLHQKE
jgi:hypothetical protein